MGGNFANPTLVLIDTDQNLVGVYHVYTMSRGEVDGVQSAESLREDALSISQGEWTVFRGELGEGTTYLGIFMLGIISSFSPCSLFMLFAIVSYIISSDKPGKRVPNDQARTIDWRAGLWIGIAFSAGMTLTFALLGALASYAGVFIESSAAFSLIVGIALVILGINIIWPLGEFLRRLRKPGKEIAGGSDDSAKKLVQRLGRDRRGLIGLVLGILFTIGWTPCALAMVLPVLVMIMSGTVSILTGMALMCVFALGRGMVVTSFCAAIGGMKSKIYGQFIKAGKWIQPIFGIAMVALGIIYALRYWGFNLW
jgi:cytochrome c-type biogenesis protein